MRISSQTARLDEVGVTAVEYAMIACLIAIVVCAISAGVVGKSLDKTFNVIAQIV